MGLKDIADAASNKYTKLVKENPEAKLVADLTPFAGIATSGLDAANNAYKGNYAEAGVDLLGLVPGVKHIKGAGFIKDSVKYAGKGYNAARVIDKVGDAENYKTSEKPKKEVKKETKKPARDDYPNYYNYKKGGKVKAKPTASSRGDGCAQRGKTRGNLR